MIKEFLKEHPFFRLEIVYIDGFWENGWHIRLYDGPNGIMLFNHKILATAIENLNVDFETAIMTPIISWYEQQMEEKK
jgi:hypothetical protein